ncbi:MAG TPA: thiamine pyrophosphate-dependent enzyme [Thermomicrobiales bacterium]|nr:thiamine pyrophosphate-dependent enzyme [Thermomicrobiales bacterium]
MVHTQETPAKANAVENAPAKTESMTGGQALVASLLRQGIDTIFGLPGVQLDGAFDALYDAQKNGDVRILHTRHEQGAAYMADGYARVTGDIGTCMVVPGPGLLNAAAALSTAYACNQPVLCVTGQIQSDKIEGGRGLLHEIPNQLTMVRSVTKHAERAIVPSEIPGLVDRAVRSLWDGRIRPVEIEVPPDTLFAKEDVQLLTAAPGRQRMQPDPDQVVAAAKLLGQAKSPIIFVGGGIHGSEAWDELREFAEMLQAPVVMTQNGKGAISSRHYLAQNEFAAKDLLPAADVIFVVGTRFTEPTTRPWGVKDGRTVVQLDIDPSEIGANYPATIGIVADAKSGLAALVDELPKHNLARDSREDELAALKQSSQEKLDSVHPQALFAGAIRRQLPDDGIFVGEMTQIGYWSNAGFPVYEPRTYLTPGYQGTLGWGFPTSLGVKVGAPDKVVVSVNGDGGFGFCLNELATQAQHGIASITLVFNDGAYGNVRRIQKEQFSGRTIASDLKNPNYQKLAEAFGVTGRQATTPEELETQLGEAIKADEPTLIEIPVEPMPNPWTALGLR